MRKNILILGHNDGLQFIDIFNQYTRLFDPEKYAVTVAYLTCNTPEETRKRTIAENVVFLNIPKKKLRGLKISAIKKLIALCRGQPFDLVICHCYKPTYIMLWVAQFCNIPAYCFVMHALKTMSSIHRQLLLALLVRKNMLFAGVSNAVRDDLRHDLWMVPKERITTFYNVLDIQQIEKQLLSKEEARIAFNISDQDFVFGNIGRLTACKDQETLIDAFALIKPFCPRAKLIIIGHGELEQTLKNKTASLELNDDVVFAGFLPDSFRYMRAFDCFVLSSIREAFGLVLLEAMIAKRYIIATRVGGIPEVIGEVGELVTPQDVNALAMAMKHNYDLSPYARQYQGEKAYRHVVTHFSLPVFQEMFWQLSIIKGE